MPHPITRALPGQAALVGQLLADFNAEFATGGPSAVEFATRFSTLLTREDVVVLVAGADDGFALLTLRPTPYADGPLAQLDELYVRADLRDRGIGSALMAAALAAARDAGAAEMHVNVDAPDTDALRFYARHGFSHLDPDTGEARLFLERAV